MDQRMVQYIRQNLDAGYKIDAIRTALINSGFKPADIDDTINYVNSGGRSGSPNIGSAGNIEYAGFWMRFSASIWDGLILGIPMTIIMFLLGMIGATIGVPSIQYLGVLVYVVVYVYMEGVLGGTPGKSLVGISIRNEKGEFIGIPMAILRYIGRILSVLILGIGYLMIAFDNRKQGLHDKIAGSFVVKTSGERKVFVVIGIILGIIGIILFIIGIIALFIVGTALLMYLGSHAPMAGG